MGTSFVTVEYAARLADCSPRSILRQVAAGKLRAQRAPSHHHEGKETTLVAVASLPYVAQQRWVTARKVVRMPSAAPTLGELAVEAITPEAAAPQGAGLPSGLSGEKLAWAMYRFRILEPLVSGEWARSLGQTLAGQAIHNKSDFVAYLATVEFAKPNGKTERYSTGGIYRMLRRYAESGIAGLTNETRSDRGSTKLSQPLQDFVIAAYCSGGSPAQPALRSLREVARLIDQEREKRELLGREGKLLDYIRGEHDFAYLTERRRGFREFMREDGTPQAADYYLFPPASLSTLGRFVASVPEPLKMLAREGVKRYKAKAEPVILRDYASLLPMQYVVFDHRKADIFVLRKQQGRYSLVRPWETVAIDMKSRMVLACVPCVTPSAETVVSCVRQIIKRFGLFTAAYMDNGKEFTAEWVDGEGAHEAAAAGIDDAGDALTAARGVFGQLGIETLHAMPFNARAKLIEPSFRNPARYERTLAGACGNRSEHRPEWLSQWTKEFKRWGGENDNNPFYTFDEFRLLKQHYYFEVYNRRIHTGREMKGRSPDQVMREEYLTAGLARTVDPRALDLLLQKRRNRIVQQGGTLVVRFGGEDRVFTDPKLFLLQGREVETSHDPQDLGEMCVYEPAGNYICTATCQELHGMGEREISEPIKRQRQLLSGLKKALSQQHRYASVPSPMEQVAWQRRLAEAHGTPAAASAEGQPANTPLPERFQLAAAVAGAQRVVPAAAETPEEERLTLFGVEQ